MVSGCFYGVTNADNNCTCLLDVSTKVTFIMMYDAGLLQFKSVKKCDIF